MNLKDFLKLYTAVDEKFIDEYYKFYELCDNDHYGIHLDKVIEYLEIKKIKAFYERFREHYSSPADYIIKIQKRIPVRGIKYRDYYITLKLSKKQSKKLSKKQSKRP